MRNRSIDGGVLSANFARLLSAGHLDVMPYVSSFSHSVHLT